MCRNHLEMFLSYSYFLILSEVLNILKLYSRRVRVRLFFLTNSHNSTYNAKRWRDIYCNLGERKAGRGV